MKEISSQSMVQQVTSMMELFLQLMLRSLVHLDVSWDGLINIEHLRLEQMLIHQLMLRKLENLVQKVSVFAVQSICSSKKTELQHSEK